MDYRVWNNKIAAHFFRGERAGQRVYLYVSQELIEQVGCAEGLAKSSCLESFVESVKDGWGLAESKNIVEAPVKWMKVREAVSDAWPYPPYLGYLALFVLAAGYGDDSDFEPNSYYPRLNVLLGKDRDAGSPPGFEQIDEVWHDLERWANIDKRGQLGHFEVQHLDSRAHVGIPVSQTLLTDQEREVAKWVFSQTGVDPALPPSEEEIAVLLLARARNKLRPRTTRLLRNPDRYPSYRSALLEALQEVLRHWDGSPVKLEDTGETPTKATSYRGTLALSLEVAFGEAHFYLRCISRREYPVGGILLVSEDGQEYLCHEIVNGWSSALQDKEGRRLDAASLDWSNDIVLEDPEQDWTFTMSPSPIRVFVNGREQGIPNINYVETRQLPLETPFYLLAHEEEGSKIEKWGELSCKGFNPVEVSGIPEGWKLYQADAARDDQNVRGEYRVLAQPREISLQLSGGVRIRPGANEYFTFAPPAIKIRSSSPVEVWCNETKLQGQSSGLYEIPNDLRSAGEVEVTARKDGKIANRKLFILHSRVAWRDTPGYGLDKFGRVMPGGSIQGACSGHDAPSRPFNFFPELLDFDAGKIYLLGARPGQVSEWPRDPLPTGWQAVWAVPKNGRARYCWPGNPGPAPKSPPNPSKTGGSEYSRSSIKKWKEILYIWRRRIDPPRSQRKLWQAYKQQASKC